MIISPNTSIRPITARTNSAGHLEIGGADTTQLAEQFGTPLWIMDEATIAQAAQACQEGLKQSQYPNWQVLYAGKAFLCLAMCRLTAELGLGLDVVSYGELHTAVKAQLPGQSIYLHGNNKSKEEIETALKHNVRIVVDCESELHLLAELAKSTGTNAKILFRVTPGVEPDTHHYIKTGQHDSKFGMPLDDVARIAKLAQDMKPEVTLLGLHAHIGSQSHDLGPYLEIIDILADCFVELKNQGITGLTHLDVGGGLGITYTEADKATPIYEWSLAIGKKVHASFSARGLALPKLLVEPGRAIVGTAGVTLYRAGHSKELPGNVTYLSVDGGMADNPRPVTYQAKYSACVANHADTDSKKVTLVGKYCESGDVLIKNIDLAAKPGDLIAVFDTGAYNYSMSSNYNRTGRPACVLVKDGLANIIIERETADDLLRQDRIPDYLRAENAKNYAL